MVRIVTLPAANQKLDSCPEIEMTFQCPACFTIETLFLEGGSLTRTPHWKQIKGKVYHRNCCQPARIIYISRSAAMLPSGTAVLVLRILRRYKVSPGQLAREIGVDRITVKRWVSGKTRPNRTSRERIAGYLGIPPEVIFP